MRKVVLLALAMALALPAMARGRLSFPANERWKAECGSCHVAYPPPLLAAAGWRRLMAQLERHFGSDASLDAGTAAEIGAFLERYGGRGADEGLRITQTRWFRHEHRELRPENASNCAACHQGDLP